MSIKVSIYGATGYTGIELYRRLKNRKGIEIKYLVSKRNNCKRYGDVVNSFYNIGDEILTDKDNELIINDSDVIFTALPYGESMKIAKYVKKYNKKMIDIGTDFRIKDTIIYKKCYGLDHIEKDILKESIYCIPELHRNKINNDTWIISNPGCYPTSVQLAISPLLMEKDLILKNSIIIDSKSGVSGGGRGLSIDKHYCEQNENIHAYKIGEHRHQFEMEEQFKEIIKEDINIMFVPHLLPSTRGIFSTIYCKLNKNIEEDYVRKLLKLKYKNEYFVTILDKGVMPHTKWVLGSNNCFINLKLDKSTGFLVLVSVIDNLIKGASGQAIQNMNILFKLNEKEGIDNFPIYP